MIAYKAVFCPAKELTNRDVITTLAQELRGKLAKASESITCAAGTEGSVTATISPAIVAESDNSRYPIRGMVYPWTNSLFHTQGFGFNLYQVTAEFDGVHLPKSPFQHPQSGSGRFMNSSLGEVKNGGNVMVTVKAKNKTVTVSTTGSEDYPSVLRSQHLFEEWCVQILIIHRLHSGLRRLIVAQRSGNQGQIQRFQDNLSQTISCIF